ncbi:PQQ-binding-like beta-propeller repeat protein [Mycolicibacterium vaccae]|uniref:outer membrane protein assembly factor BamB family protein n=1 Tax=Mycolicibacterium vaccae TaxID=1810 RepID=UPI003CEE03CD
MLRRIFVVAAATLVTATVASCGTTDSWVDARPADGWSAQYADAANSSHAPVEGAERLRLEWTRSVKGELAAQAATGSGNYLALNGQTEAGCSLMVWEIDNRARQRWCTRLWQGGGLSSPLFDGFDNLYIGQPGAVLSFPSTQWIRWRKPVIGMPTTMRILDPGHLLVVTHLGQVLVFDTHRGTVVGTALDLVAGVDPTDSERGLGDCRAARPGCPISAAPAFSEASRMVVVPLWEPGADAPVLVGLRYRPGQSPLLAREWTSDAVGGGPLGSPVLSGDGDTIYVNGRDDRLWALNVEDGSAKWSAPLDYLAQTPPSVRPDGLIVAGGGPGAQLTALRDNGDDAEVVWKHDDVEPLTTTSIAGAGYVVVRHGDGMALATVGLDDGHIVDTHPLPNATGWPVGVSVAHNGRVVAATSDGRVYGFAPA